MPAFPENPRLLHGGAVDVIRLTGYLQSMFPGQFSPKRRLAAFPRCDLGFGRFAEYILGGNAGESKQDA